MFLMIKKLVFQGYYGCKRYIAFIWNETFKVQSEISHITGRATYFLFAIVVFNHTVLDTEYRAKQGTHETIDWKV